MALLTTKLKPAIIPTIDAPKVNQAGINTITCNNPTVTPMPINIALRLPIDAAQSPAGRAAKARAIAITTINQSTLVISS